MINVLLVIQIVLFTLVVIPCLYLIIKELFNKSNNYKKRQILFYSSIILISMLFFIILSIIITYNDSFYLSMKYAPLIQSWTIIRSTLSIYAQVLSIVIGCIGIYSWFILICEKRINKSEYNLIDCDVPKKLSLRQKIEYPFMWYELYINVKMIKDKYYILTDLAVKDLQEFEDKEYLDEQDI